MTTPGRRRSFPSGRAAQQALLAALLLGLIILTVARHATPVWSQDPYPAPGIPEIDPIEETPLSEEVSQPYPAPDAAAPGIVGEDSLAIPEQPAGQPDPAADSPAQSPAGLYFLWGSFLAALLIFATAVVGSVVLFARRLE